MTQRKRLNRAEKLTIEEDPYHRSEPCLCYTTPLLVLSDCLVNIDNNRYPDPVAKEAILAEAHGVVAAGSAAGAGIGKFQTVYC